MSANSTGLNPSASPNRAYLLEVRTDEQIVDRVLAGEALLFEILMRRHNQRIYRAIRSVLRDDAECEDVMQETYVRAYEHLAQFEGRAKFSTWLTRIAVNEAIKRSIARGKLDPMDLEDFDGEGSIMLASRAHSDTPENNVAHSELRALLEESILALPVTYRTVLILRDIEEMSTAENGASSDAHRQQCEGQAASRTRITSFRADDASRRI